MPVAIEPVGRVQATRKRAEDDFRGGEESCIVLSERFGADAMQGIEAFSHDAAVLGIECELDLGWTEGSAAFRLGRFPRVHARDADSGAGL